MRKLTYWAGIALIVAGIVLAAGCGSGTSGSARGIAGRYVREDCGRCWLELGQDGTYSQVDVSNIGSGTTEYVGTWTRREDTVELYPRRLGSLEVDGYEGKAKPYEISGNRLVYQFPFYGFAPEVWVRD